MVASQFATPLAHILTRRSMPLGSRDDRLFDDDVSGSTGVRAAAPTHLVVVVLAGIVCSICAIQGEFLSVIPWGICFGLAYVISRELKYFLHTPVDLTRLCLTSYVVLSLIGHLILLSNRSIHGIDFGTNFDDSYYFDNVLQLVHGGAPAATAYEYIMAGWYLLVSCFIGSPQNLDLLPLNWLLAAVAVSLSGQVAYQFAGRACPPWLLYCLVLGNSVYTDAVANLYREGLMLIALFGCILAAQRHRYALACVLAGLCCFVRVASGALGFLFILLSLANGIEFFRRNTLVFGTTVMAAIVAFMAADNAMKFGAYGRSFEGDEGVAGNTVFDMAETRSQTDLLSGEESGNDDLTARLSRLGPVGYLLMPVSDIFSPIRFKSLQETTEIQTCYEGERFITYGSLTRPQHVFEWITVGLWSFTGPYLVLGFVGMIKPSRGLADLCFFFLACLVAFTFVSYLPRHRTPLILMYPTFAALASCNPDCRNLVPGVRAIFVVVIVAINLITMIF